MRQRICTLKTGIPAEDVDPILKLLRGVSRPEIQLGVAIHSELDFLTSQVVIKIGRNIFTLHCAVSLRRLSTSSFVLNFSECRTLLVMLYKDIAKSWDPYN